MPVYTKCPSCQQQIPFGKLFCPYCGAKIEITHENVTTETSAQEKRDLLRRVKGYVIITVLVLTFLYLLFWPKAMPGMLDENTWEADAARFDQRSGQIERDIAADATKSEYLFTEQEINAYLRKAIEDMDRAGKKAGFGFHLTKVRVDLKGKNLVAACAQARGGPLTLSFYIDGRLDRVVGGFEFAADKCRIGHLPWPGFASSIAEGQIARVFSGLQRERKFLDQAYAVEIMEDQVVLRFNRR